MRANSADAELWLAYRVHELARQGLGLQLEHLPTARELASMGAAALLAYAVGTEAAAAAGGAAHLAFQLPPSTDSVQSALPYLESIVRHAWLATGSLLTLATWGRWKAGH
jgi:hypothetical protein